jgi:hypothetical protein
MEFIYKLIEYVIDKPEAISAIATVVAAALTYKVAKSSEETAERSVKIAKDMRDMEIINEGPKLNIKHISYGQTQSYVRIINYGTSVATNLKFSEPFNTSSQQDINPYGTAGNTHTDIYLSDSNFSLNDLNEEYYLIYSNAEGRRFKSLFVFLPASSDQRVAVTNKVELV